MPYMNIGVGPAPIPPMNNPFTSGLPVAGQMCGAGSTGRMFSPASGGFQLGDGFRSPAQRAMHAAAGEAHAGMLDQVRQCMTPSLGNDNIPTGGLRLIDSAQSKALDSVLRHADDPAQAEQVYATGRYAARIGVEDLAVALSELRMQGGAPEDCERMEKALCKMIVKDGLGDHSGFSAWHDGNCYDKVKKLTEEINTRFDALPGKGDIFDGVMQREVMPAIRQYIQVNYGNQSYETWQKIDAAGGLISHAAAEAADRMTATLRAGMQEGGAGGLRAKVNQWRVAQHWAEMMRSVAAKSDQAPAPVPAAAPEHAAPTTVPAAATRLAAAAAPYSVTQTANPVFKPIIVIGGREVNGALTRILEHDEATSARDGAGDTVAAPVPHAAARRTVEAGRPDMHAQRNEAMDNDVERRVQDQTDGGSEIRPQPEMPPSLAQETGQARAKTDGGSPHGNAMPSTRSLAQALRVTIPSPPPLPTTASASVSVSPAPSTTSTASTPSVGVHQVEVHRADDDAVTLRNRPLSPVRQLIKQFEDAGIGAQSPIGNAAHIGSLLRNAGNRISTTEWPLLRSVSDGDGGGSRAHGGDRGSQPSSPVAAEPVLLRSRPLSPPLQPGYTRLSSEVGRAAASPYQRVSTAGRAVQVGPGFEPFRGA